MKRCSLLLEELVSPSRVDVGSKSSELVQLDHPNHKTSDKMWNDPEVERNSESYIMHSRSDKLDSSNKLLGLSAYTTGFIIS
jgi:predicted NUDIX family NTP pyrophosphohydrolase